MNNERQKNIVLAVLLVAVVTLTIAYAALSATLNVNGTAIVKGNQNNWKVEFVKTADDSDAAHMTCVPTGHATVGTQPTINSTSFSGLVANFQAPGDTVVCKWNVENNGSINASLGTFTKPTDAQLTCTGTTGDTKTADEAAVCNNIHYTLTYDPSGAIATGNTLNAGQDRGLIMTITYDSNASALPTNDVTITGFNTTFVYNQA